MRELWAQLLFVFAISIVISGTSRALRSDQSMVSASNPGTSFGQNPSTQDKLTSLKKASFQDRSQPGATGNDGVSAAENAAQEEGDAQADLRLREGKLVHDANAQFQIMGERINCNLNQQNGSVVVLENLTLERVHHYLSRGNGNASWEIEGIITEYEGHNYLLLKRAIVNSVEIEN